MIKAANIDLRRVFKLEYKQYNKHTTQRWIFERAEYF